MNNYYKFGLELLKKITENNYKAYIVGGYPRDLYLGIKSNDIDICTSAKYEELKEIFPNIINNNYGSYILEYKDYKYEITTFRKEISYRKNRFPTIKLIKNLKKDIKRRDFTINTLCIDKNGRYVDLLKIKKDIDGKIIRLVNNEKSLEQDALRILRAIRFSTVLDFKLDKKLKKGIYKYKDNLKNISYDRKKEELTKIFKSKNMMIGVNLIREFELEKYLSIDLENIKPCKNVNAIWAQVLIDDSYNFSKKDRKEINLFNILINKKFELYDLYKYGKEKFMIVNEIKKEKINVQKEYDNLPIKDRQEIDITIYDFLENNRITYESISKILEEIEIEIIYKRLKNKKKSIKSYIEKKYKHTL